jgi:hypothetical protein
MSDEDLAREALLMDAGRSTIVLFVGMKGSGKSAAARVMFDQWPHDRVVVDPTGSAWPDDPQTIALKAPFPSQLPEPDPDTDPPQTRVTVWARIDPRSATFAFDQDQAMAMALHPRRRTKLIWRDEFGQGVSAHKTLPNDNALLLSSRHYEASALLVTQRPRHIPTVALQQADKFLIFRLPSPADREHVAANAGIPLPVFERQYHDSQRRHPHAFLLYDRKNDVLLNCPPLPGIKAHGPAA